MPLRPDEIENREFASSLRGFDKHEVRAFLRRVASDVDELETQVASRESIGADAEQAAASSSSSALIDEDRFAALGDRIAGLLRQAHEAANETRQQAEEKSLQLRSTAEDELEQARVDAGRLREEAEAAAAALRDQAENESNRLRGEAGGLRSEADRLHAEAVVVRNDAEDYANHLRGEAEAVRAEAEEFAAHLRGEADGVRSEAERVRVEAERLLGEAQVSRSEADEYAGRVRGEAESDAVAIRDRAELEGAARLDERRMVIEQAEVEIESARRNALAEVSEARQQVTSLLEEARAQSEFIKREAEEIVRAKVRTNIDQAQRRIDVLRNTETSSRNRILTAQRELEAALNRLDAEAAPELGHQIEDDVLAEAEQRSMEADYPPFRAGEPADPFSGGEVIEAQVIEGQVIDGPERSYHPSPDAHGEAAAPEEAEAEGGGSEGESGAVSESEDALARLVREAMQRAVEGARNENR